MGSANYHSASSESDSESDLNPNLDSTYPDYLEESLSSTLSPFLSLWDSSGHFSQNPAIKYPNTSDILLIANGTYETNLTFISNSTTTWELPPELSQMSQSARTSVLVYSIIWIIAAAGNLTVFASCYRQYKKHKSRITLLILHLSVADLIVTFCLIPIEIAWRITIQWYGGNVLCKLCQFLRAFGLYLSSMVLICVSFDRFFSILFPLKFAGGKQRVQVMLGMAWVASGVFSAPQAIFFSVETHPRFPTFRQCVTSSFLTKPEDVKLYSIFSVSAMYFAPLLVIIFTYTAILLKIIRKYRKSRQNNLSNTTTNTQNKYSNAQTNNTMTTTIGSPNVDSNQLTPTPSPGSKRGSKRFKFSRHSIERSSSSTRRRGSSRRGRGNLLEVPGESSLSGSPNFSGNRLQLEEDQETISNSTTNNTNNCDSIKSNGKTQLILRMSTNATSNIARAKNRTLRLTIVIVLFFVLCWTPYVFMTLWYMFDWETAQRVDPRVQDALFMMAVANSCVNPLVYGSFTKNCCGITKKLNRTGTKKSNRPTTIKEALESQASNN